MNYFLAGYLGHFPPPTTPEEVGTRVLAQERYEELGDDVEMEVESDQELSEAEDERRNTSVDNTQVTHNFYVEFCTS